MEKAVDLYSRCVYPIGYAAILDVLSYPKPGNVSRFSPRGILDSFLYSAASLQKYLLAASIRGYIGVFREHTIGDLLYMSVRDSVTSRGAEELLGEKILLLPLALACGRIMAENKGTLDPGETAETARRILAEYSSIDDSVMLYRAIRLAAPAGLAGEPESGYPSVWSDRYEEQLRDRSLRLWDIVVDAARRELVFDELLCGYCRSLEALEEAAGADPGLDGFIVEAYRYLLRRYPDTLIARRHGYAAALEAYEAARRAMDPVDYIVLDAVFRRRGWNPGSIADIAAAATALYLLRAGKMGDG